MGNLQLALPQAFFAAETRCGFEVTPARKRAWAVLLDLVAAFDRVCTEHGIRYFAYAGTLLGAVRHRGFIPWDDDVDFVVPWDDYQRLCQIGPTAFRPPYVFQTEETDPGSLRGHIQIRNQETTGILAREAAGRWPFCQGMFIDVFPLVEAPDDDAALRRWSAELDILHGTAMMLAFFTTRYRSSDHLLLRPFKGVVHQLFRALHISYAPIWRAYLRTQAKFIGRGLPCVAEVATGMRFGGRGLVFPKELFEKRLRYPFECLQIPIAFHYEKMLTIAFGGGWRRYLRTSTAHGGVIVDPDHPAADYFAGKTQGVQLTAPMEIQIIVATHKPYAMPEETCYLPVHAGRALHPAAVPDITGDDTGENISAKNPSYCELTALYWAWKNVPADYIGLMHYRRCFTRKEAFHVRDRRKEILTRKEWESLLAKHPIVVSGKRRYFIETNRSHYLHAHHREGLDAAEAYLRRVWPTYLPAYETVMNRTWAHMFNMFVMRSDVLDAYCRWLFPLIADVEAQIDTTGWDAFESRVCGFVSELMLDVWLEANHVKYYEQNVSFLEHQDWLRKGGAFLRRKLLPAWPDT